VLRVFLVIPIYLAYQNSALTWALVLYFLAWATDIIDGRHARYRQQESRLGMFLDPAADKVLVLGTLLTIGPGRFSLQIIGVILALELLLVLVTLIIGPLSGLFFRKQRRLGANRLGKIKMLLQGTSLGLLFLGLNSSALQILAEAIMWCAASVGFISIPFYLTTRSEEKARD
jgi:cardiolipin synthase